MRNLNDIDSRCRVPLPEILPGYSDNSGNGAFVFVSPHNGEDLRVIATSTHGWDHVSVSCKHRCPTWDEMEYVARLFFKRSEYAFQLHVPPHRHVNCHPYTLHWWRPHKDFPVPPEHLV